MSIISTNGKHEMQSLSVSTNVNYFNEWHTRNAISKVCQRMSIISTNGIHEMQSVKCFNECQLFQRMAYTKYNQQSISTNVNYFNEWHTRNTISKVFQRMSIISTNGKHEMQSVKCFDECQIFQRMAYTKCNQ